MHYELTNIKVWAEQSANTLLLEAAQGAYDDSTKQLTIPHPVWKATSQKTVDDRSSVSYMQAYVDGQAQGVNAAAAHPAPAPGGHSGQTPPPVIPRFARRKMKMKTLSGRGVKLEPA